jgi:hypothetical protein
LKTTASGTPLGNITALADPSLVDVLFEENKSIDVEIG